MRATIVRRELREQLRAVAGWGGGLAAMVLMYSAFWPSIRGNASEFEAYIRNLPEAFRNIVGELSLSTPVGYLQAELFSFLGPALILVFAIGAGARTIAGEEERRTMDVLASAPIPRARIVVEKFLAMAAVGIGIGAVLWVALIVIGPVFGLDVPAANLAAATLQLVLLGLAFGSFALLLSAWTGRRGVAAAAAAGVAVGTFLLDAFAPAVEGLDWATTLSPFHYYGDRLPLRDGLPVTHASVLLGVTIVCVVLSAIAFERRDLRT